MYNLAISLGIGVALFLGVALWLGPLAGILPGLGTAAIAMFLLSRRTANQVQQEIAQIVPLLQARQVKEAEAKIMDVQQRYSKWQFLLEGQLEAQLGMIQYMQMKFDNALPKLIAGQWRNWEALGCIGAIHYRKGRKAEAWEAFAKAASASSKESLIYAIWATLLVRDGERTKALKVVSDGLAQSSDSKMLKELKKKIANKKKIKHTMFGDGWYQFFPEDMAKQMMIQGQRGQGPAAIQQPRIGARRAPRR